MTTGQPEISYLAEGRAGDRRNAAQDDAFGAANGASPGLVWYAVNAHTGKEALAAEHLGRQAFEVCLPLFERTVRHARRITRRRAAFFPGYLFVQVDPKTVRWRAINGTRGVKSLVMTGDRPAALPGGVVEAFQAATNDKGLIERDGNGLARGDRVRMVAGPFADLPGRVEHLSGAERVRVLIELLHGHFPVVLKRSDVVRLEGPDSRSGGGAEAGHRRRSGRGRAA